jgi:Tetratricopeptide repeat/TPR repeat/SnoaL-like domain
MVLVAALPRAFGKGVAAALCALWLAAPSAAAASLDKAAALLKAGERAQALSQVDELLASDPKDPRARFLKGVILTEQGDAKAAADVFQRLTQDYPKLPEPYNNLAVIYAAQGHYDQARAALEKSLHTHPSYATAYENLGDVYAKLASEAYDRALRLDGSDPGARKNLALVRELAGPAPLGVATRTPAPPPAPAKPAATVAVPSPAPVKPAPPAVAAAAPVKPEPAAAQPPAPATPAPPVVAAATPAKPPAARSDASAPNVVAAAKPLPATPSSASNPDAGILRRVKDWAQAWSAKDVDAYLACYAPAFKTPDGAPRAAWENERRARITGPRSIKVSIRNPKIVHHDDRRAAVVFQQTYRSDRFQGHTRKTLELVRIGDDWRIVEEVVK